MTEYKNFKISNTTKMPISSNKLIIGDNTNIGLKNDDFFWGLDSDGEAMNGRDLYKGNKNLRLY